MYLQILYPFAWNMRIALSYIKLKIIGYTLSINLKYKFKFKY